MEFGRSFRIAQLELPGLAVLDIEKNSCLGGGMRSAGWRDELECHSGALFALLGWGRQGQVFLVCLNGGPEAQ
jgi:hypothetical protein